MNAVERELAVARAFATCRGDEERLDEAVAEIAQLRAEVQRLNDAADFFAAEAAVLRERRPANR